MALAAWAAPSKELSGMPLQAIGQLDDGVERQVALAGCNAYHIRAMEVRGFGKVLLTHAGPSPSSRTR